MIWRRIAIASAVVLIVALGMAPPAEAGFWGDLKRSLGTAVDNARHDGAEAIDAITGDGDGTTALDAGEFAGAPETAKAPAARPLDSPAEPVTDGAKQLTKQPKQ